MAPPDQGSGGPPRASALRRQMSCTCACTCSREEPTQHARRLSCSASFSSPAASPSPSTASASTTYLPASNKSSCESIPFADAELGKQSSFSSTSSYESFFHIEATDHDGSKFLEFEPATRAPAVQTMTGQQQAAAAYDPKRLPSAMFRTRSSTSPAQWSVTSNESLFSIQLSNSGDLTALYGDLYYDAAGFPRFPSIRSEAGHRLPSVSEASGGLCVREDCARCSGSGMIRKSVRFAAATESVSGGSKHSAVSPPGRESPGGGAGQEDAGDGGRVVPVRVLLAVAADDVVASLLRMALPLLRLRMLMAAMNLTGKDSARSVHVNELDVAVVLEGRMYI